MGWKAKWVSSYNSDFNYDFHVSFTKDQLARGEVYYNYGIAKEAGPGRKGLVSATFQLEGQEFIALNGGPQFKFTEAISLFVNCETVAP
jgi:predicted dithiol-disulfide oxidoreductase (DUF899 family)